MKHIYAFESKEDFSNFQGIIERFTQNLLKFQYELEQNYALRDLPKGIVCIRSISYNYIFPNTYTCLYKQGYDLYFS